MTDMNLNELTVLELRKVAKEMKVPLGAGISKQGIIDKLTMAIAEQGDAVRKCQECSIVCDHVGKYEGNVCTLCNRQCNHN
mgnify:CR=1 FL=1